MLRLLLIAGLATAAAASSYSTEANNDRITSLPGAQLKYYNFSLFSGYIDVTATKDGSRKLFYWFVESARDPAADPVLLWTNGGPGCSGLNGFMTEQGPFRPTKDGRLVANEFAWNTIANVIYIEQPAGVGFSTVAGSLKYGDAEAAADNHVFIKRWFERYSNFAQHDFYLTSESYGGHYLPTLAKSLTDAGDVTNFKGLAVGNPLTYMPYRNYGQYGTAAGHNLFAAPDWDAYLKAGCRTAFPPSDACNAITDKFDELTAGLDPYALDFPVCADPALMPGRAERHAMAKIIARAKKTKTTNDNKEAEAMLTMASSPYFPTTYEPCDSDWMTSYLNRKDVRAAIHVDPSVGNWSSCSDAINSGFPAEDTNAPMMPYWKHLVQQPGLKLMVYSGDDDSVCATLGTQQWVWELGLPVTSAWAPWTVAQQVAGFSATFGGSGDGSSSNSSSESALLFATVHGAGHMCPATRPAQMLELLRRFLDGK